MKPIKVTLQSSPLIHAPGMINRWKLMARGGERWLAFLQISHGFPQLPGLMVIDILDGRLRGDPTGKEAIAFTWEGPLGQLDDYWLGRWTVLGPDDIPITPEAFASKAEAETAIARFVKRFRVQGYYSTADGLHIPVSELREHLRFERTQ
jgi:hypothetical protein